MALVKLVVLSVFWSFVATLDKSPSVYNEVDGLNEPPDTEHQLEITSVKVNLPTVVRKKEVLKLQIDVVVPHVHYPLKVTVIADEHFALKSSDTQSLCNGTGVTSFELEAVRVGESRLVFNVSQDGEADCEDRTISETNLTESYTFERRVTVDSEGYASQKVQSAVICGSNTRFDKTVSWSLKLPRNTIDSSTKLTASVSDFTFGSFLKNSNQILEQTEETAENVLTIFVANYLVLKRFENETEEFRKYYINNLKLYYNKLLNFSHVDGSFSRFGNSDHEGSIRLTSYVVKYLSQARLFIDVDEELLSKGVQWVTGHQMINGCFPNDQPSKKYSKHIKPNPVITSEILDSLLENGVTEDSDVIKKATVCLKQPSKTGKIYSEVMRIYALLSLNETREAHGRMRTLLHKASRTYKMFWLGNKGDSKNTKIMITSFAVLCLVRLGGSLHLEEASDAVRWINLSRNKYGGFLSAYDTVTALEAMSKFAVAVEQNITGAEVDLSTGRTRTNFSTSINEHFTKSISLSPELSFVEFVAKKPGCALLQTVLEYKSRQVHFTKSLKLYLTVEPDLNSPNCSVLKMNVCMSKGGKRNSVDLALLTVAIPTGYEYSNIISSDETVKVIQNETEINFFIQKLSNSKVCVDLLLKKIIDLDNLQTSQIILRDYYRPDKLTAKKYKPNLSKCFKEIEPHNKTKRESSTEFSNESEFDGFVDLGEDLEVPPISEDMEPTYILPPLTFTISGGCPLCFKDLPRNYASFYCTSQAVVKMLVRGPTHMDFVLDVSRGRNITKLRNSVSVTKKSECRCAPLEAVGDYALLLIQPPRAIDPSSLHILHLDFNIQVIHLSGKTQLSDYIAKCSVF